MNLVIRGITIILMGASIVYAQEASSRPPRKQNVAAGLEQLDGLFTDPKDKALEEFKQLHPINNYKARDKKRLVNDTRKFMELDDATIKALIPEQTVRIDCKCPKCNSDKYWKLDFKRLDRLYCSKCRGHYPNKTYPENYKQTFHSYFCKSVTVPYHKDKKGKKYCFYGKLNELKYNYITNFWQAEAVGHAYHLTKDPRFARRARVILMGIARNSDRFLYCQRGAYAQLYPWPRSTPAGKAKAMFPANFKPKKNWDINREAPFHCGVFPTQQQPYGALISLYDLTYRDNCYEEKVKDGRRTITARDFIDTKVFGRLVEYLSAASDAFGDAPHTFNNTGNIVSQYMIPGRAARVTGRAKDLRFMSKLLLTLPMDKYRITYDRCSLEGPGYHGCWLGGYLLSVRDLTTMPGAQGKALQKIFRKTAGYKELTECRDRVRFPNGTLPILNDDARRKFYNMPFLRQSIGNILPGLGYAVLGDGRKPMEQIQLHMDFTKMHNHGHHDSLAIQLFANGREKLTDPGTNYTDGSLYNWGAGTLAHNTVVVDCRNQNETWGKGGGQLLVFAPNMPGLSMMRADSSNIVYEKNVTRYRRTLIMNTVDLAAPYVIDVFEVEGGSTHDYSLHGSCYDHQPNTFSATIPMKPMSGDRPLMDPGVKWKPARGAFQGIDERQLYGFFRNVKSAALAKNTCVEFAYKDQKDSRIRSHFKADPSLTLYAGESPAVARRPFWKKVKDLPITRWMPHMLLRHRDVKTKSLKSLFVVVHEPIKGKPHIDSFDWKRDGEAINLTVQLKNGRRDVYSLALGVPTVRTYQGLTTDGLLGAMAMQGGNQDLWLIGGTYAKSDKKQVALAEAMPTGRVLDYGSKRFGANDHFLLTDAKLPHTPFMAGEVIFIDFLNKDGSTKFSNAFEVIAVKREGVNSRVILRDDPWLSVSDNSVGEHYYPYRKAATCRVRWIASRSTVPSVAITPNVGRYSASRTNQYIPFAGTQAVQILADRPGVPVRSTTDGSAPTAANGQLGSSRSLTAASTVRAVAGNPGGVMAPRPVSQEFVGTIAATATSPAGLESGLVLKVMKNNVGTMLSKGMDAIGVSRTHQISDFDATLIQRGEPAVIKGFLMVPETGMYAFESHTYPESRVKIGSQWIVNDISGAGVSHSNTHWWFHRADVPLQKGLHPIRVEYYCDTSQHGNIWLFWAPPGKPLEKIPTSALFRTPTPDSTAKTKRP